MTGNGPGALGDAFVALQTSDAPPGLTLAAAHQPPNHDTLDRTDSDLGSGGPLWLPPGLIVGGGKEGRYEVLDARTLALSQDHGDAGARPGRRLPGVRELVPRRSARARLRDAAALDLPHQLRHRRRPRLLRRPRALPGRRGLRPQRQRRPGLLVRGRSRLRARLPDGGARLSQGVSLRHRDPPPRRDGRSSPRPCGRSKGCRAGSARSPPTARATASSGCRIRSATDSGRTCRGGWRRSTPRRWASSGTTTAATCSPSSRRRQSPADASSGRRSRARSWSTACARTPRLGRSSGARSIGWRRCSGHARSRRPRRSGAPPSTRSTGWSGGESGFLGRPVFDARPVQDAAGGWYRDFQGVIIGDVPSTVAVRHYVRAPSPVPGRHPWLGLGTPFTSSIYWSRPTGAHIVTGEIRDSWLGQRRPDRPARLSGRR